MLCQEAIWPQSVHFQVVVVEASSISYGYSAIEFLDH